VEVTVLCFMLQIWYSLYKVLLELAFSALTLTLRSES